jgi:hypothetical protein
MDTPSIIEGSIGKATYESGDECGFPPLLSGIYYTE